MVKENKNRKELIDKNRHKLLRIISILPAFFMMCLIFWFSSKPAQESEKTSTPIAKAVMSVYESISGPVEADEQEKMLSTIDFFVRKTAHVTEYTILAVFMAAALWGNGLRKKKRLILVNLISTILYASTDEFHQLFVEGRAGRAADVGIDSIGCILGTVFFCLIVTIYQKKKNRSNPFK